MATVLATTFPNPAALKINSPNGVVFNQSATGGGIPAEGSGVRFMWYPGKAALRAGYVSDTSWDDGKIGINSMATGMNTIANGLDSTAMGLTTTASGGASTALGYNTTASGLNSTAMGASTTASGENSTALGLGTLATGDTATAMGTAVATGDYSTAMGYRTFARGKFATAIGVETTAESADEVAIGSFNTDYTPKSTMDWIGTDRLFVTGNGTGTTALSDALVVLKSGNVGIGTSTPTYRLQLGTDSAGKPGGGSWSNSSDARLKDISGPYDRGLEAIAALQPVRFHYAVGNARGHDPAPEYVGFIAQQAQAVFPEAVSEGADGYLDFNMHAVNVAMVNAIQTLNEQNQVQQELILDLRSENAALVQRLASLEAENARLTQLQADLTQIQEQLKVLQGQLAASASHGQIALGR